jgi:hypothetical protein
MSTSKLKFENSADISIVGTFLQGYIGSSFDNLKEVFGDPSIVYEDSSTTVEWVLQLKVPSGNDFDYVTATIYDRREDYQPLADTSKEGVWHIGGFEKSAVDAVYEAMGK